MGELGGMLYSLKGYEFLKILEQKYAIESPKGQSTIPTPAKTGTGLFLTKVFAFIIGLVP